MSEAVSNRNETAVRAGGNPIRGILSIAMLCAVALTVSAGVAPAGQTTARVQPLKAYPSPSQGPTDLNLKQWEEFNANWSDAFEFLPQAKKAADRFHLDIGEWPDGIVRDSDSTSNNLTGSYFPNLLSAYAQWKMASVARKADETNTEAYTTRYEGAANMLFPVTNSDIRRAPVYQLPCIQLMYISSSLWSDRITRDIVDRMKAAADWRAAHTERALAMIPSLFRDESIYRSQCSDIEAAWQNELLQKENDYKRLDATALKKRMTQDRADFLALHLKEISRTAGDFQSAHLELNAIPEPPSPEQRARLADIKAGAALLTIAFQKLEIAEMRDRTGRGVPELLAYRLVEAEKNLIDEIAKRLYQIETGKAATLTGPITGMPKWDRNTITFDVKKFPFPIDAAPVLVGRNGTKHDARPVGPSAQHILSATVTLALDRNDLLQHPEGSTYELALQWQIPHRIAQTISYYRSVFQTHDQPNGVSITSNSIHLDGRANFFQLAGNPNFTGLQSDIAFTTDLGENAAWLQYDLEPRMQDRAPIRIMVDAPKARFVRYRLKPTTDSMVYLPNAEFVPAGKVDERFLVTIDRKKLPIGQYSLQIQLTDSTAPEKADWIERTVDHGFGIVDRRVAFVVGVRNYLNETGNLEFSANDAEDFKTALTNKAHYAPQNVVFLYDPIVGSKEKAVNTTLTNASGDISRSLFQRAFNKLMEVVRDRKATSVILFYSGHGTQEDNHNSLILSDGGTVKISELIFNLSTYAGFDQPGAHCNIVGLYDACRNGRADLKPTPIKFYGTDTVRYFPIYACDAGEASVELSSFTDSAGHRQPGHGVFTYAVLDAINIYGPFLTLDQLVRSIARTYKRQEIHAAIVSVLTGGTQHLPGAAVRTQHLRVNQHVIDDPDGETDEKQLRLTHFLQKPDRRHSK